MQFKIYLFGSRMRGDNRDNSDWDFLIVPEDPITVSIYDDEILDYEVGYSIATSIPAFEILCELEIATAERVDMFVQTENMGVVRMTTYWDYNYIETLTKPITEMVEWGEYIDGILSHM